MRLIFCAMTLGDKQELDPEIQMRYQLAGIIHILAISGLHISILGMGLYNLLKKMGLGIWPAGIFSLGVMLQYGIMTGGECFHHAGSNYVSDRHGSQDHRTDL